MTSLDTNVLVQYLAQDDEAQFQSVLRLLNRKGGRYFVCDLVLAETDWVLRSLFNWTANEVADAFARLTTIHNLVFEDEARLRAALRSLRQGADLADELIARQARESNCAHFVTFDKEINRRHKPFAQLPV